MTLHQMDSLIFVYHGFIVWTYFLYLFLAFPISCNYSKFSYQISNSSFQITLSFFFEICVFSKIHTIYFLDRVAWKYICKDISKHLTLLYVYCRAVLLVWITKNATTTHLLGKFFQIILVHEWITQKYLTLLWYMAFLWIPWSPLIHRCHFQWYCLTVYAQIITYRRKPWKGYFWS